MDQRLIANGVPLDEFLPKKELEELKTLPHRIYKASLDDVVASQIGADRAWKSGQPTYRWVEKYRTQFWVVLYQRVIPTEVKWIKDFGVDGPLQDYTNKLREVLDDDPMISLVMSFMTMKTLQKSDTPAWFSLSEDLMCSLLATQLKGVQTSDVKVPLPGFYIEIPEKMLYLRNEYTGDHEVRTIGVVEGYLDEEGLENPPEQRGYLGRRLLLVVNCEPNENSTSVYDDHVIYLSLPMTEESNIPVDEMIADENKVLQTLNLPDESEHGGHVLGVAYTYGEIMDLIRSFVINFLLYLASPKADIKHKNDNHIKRLRKKKKRSKTIKAQIKRLLSEPSWIVGSRVVVDSGVRQSLRNEGTKLTRKAAYNVLVRGHWRRQWRGKKSPESPKGTDWSWIWIAPTVRNFDALKMIKAHEYKVK